MTRGLHPHTRQQRAQGDDGDWQAPRSNAPEGRDAPPRRVAQVLAATLLTLFASIGAIDLLFNAIEQQTPIGAAAAEARFRTAGPPLTPDPLAERIAVEAPAIDHLIAQPGARTPAIDQAMREVVREGWGDTAAPPSTASTALDRAEAHR